MAGKRNKVIPQGEWKWFGHAGHFICGAWCRFHLCTLIGKYVVSTVGDYHGVMQIRDKGERTKAEEIGCGRKYETLVFKGNGETCTAAGCACGLPYIDPSEIDSLCCNTAGEATKNHYALCAKWARRQKP